MITPFVAGRREPLQVELLHALTREGFGADLYRHMELDLLDREACRKAMEAARADVVIDCSAAEDHAEEESLDMLDEMLIGTENLALAAAERGARSILVSNARVFGGDNGLHVESDPPTPTTPLGAATLTAERTVARENGHHTIVRSSALYGRHWPMPFEDLYERLLAAEHLTLAADPICPPTYAPHLLGTIIVLLRTDCDGIVHRAATGECNKLEFARALVTLAELDSRIEPSTAQQIPEGSRSACLDSCRAELPAIPHWRIGLRAWALDREEAVRRDESPR